MRGRQPLDGPVELVVVAVYEWPKSWSAKRKAQPGAAWKTSKPDADNIGKLISDSLNCLAWRDDALVARLEVQKIYGQRGETRVFIKPL
jgi:Holliday junction resolvase RusA-like endonuclease